MSEIKKELLAVVENSGLETTTATQLKETFLTFIEQVQEWKAKAAEEREQQQKALDAERKEKEALQRKLETVKPSVIEEPTIVETDSNKQTIVELIEQHNIDVNNIINDFDILGDDDWRERIQLRQHHLLTKIKAL